MSGKVYTSANDSLIHKTDADVIEDLARFSKIMQVIIENMKEEAWKKFSSSNDYRVLSAFIGEASARLAEANKYVTDKIVTNNKRVF